jgi:transcription elongation factor GreA
LNNYLTEEAINKLKDELEHRQNVVRFEINDELKEARAQGDLSENYEYKAAKTERARNNGRMHYLEKMIKTAVIIQDNTADDQVGIGKTVILKFINSDEIDEFKIVTTIDADPMNNKISIESPIGKAIYKHKAGEQLKITSPQGEYYVIIDKILKGGD